jgi:hypothetical protein
MLVIVLKFIRKVRNAFEKSSNKSAWTENTYEIEKITHEHGQKFYHLSGYPRAIA